MMNIHVLEMERTAIDIPVDDSVLAVDERILEIILENKSKRGRRHFGIVDLWNIRRKARRFGIYR